MNGSAGTRSCRPLLQSPGTRHRPVLRTGPIISGPVRGYLRTIRQQLTRVNEEDHTVAEQTPSLLWVGCYHYSGVVGWIQRIGAQRLVAARTGVRDVTLVVGW